MPLICTYSLLRSRERYAAGRDEASGAIGRRGSNESDPVAGGAAGTGRACRAMVRAGSVAAVRRRCRLSGKKNSPGGAMNSMESIPLALGSGPRRSRFRRRLRRIRSSLYRPFARVRTRRRTRPGPPHRIDKKLHWRGSNPLKRSIRILVYGGGLLLLGALAWAVDAVFVHRSFVMDNRCQQRALSCGILASFLVPVLTLALVSAFFLLGRLWYLRRRYLRRLRAPSPRMWSQLPATSSAMSSVATSCAG